MENERTIATIAREIRADWRKVYFGAVPYLEAMASLDSVLATRDAVRKAQFLDDPATEILTYFLANANGWRGETARRIKAEIKSLL